MSTAIDKLRRILVLEQELLYKDKAVIGGLEPYLVHWSREARSKAAGNPEELASLEAVLTALSHYREQNQESRRASILRAIEVLDAIPQQSASMQQSESAGVEQVQASNPPAVSTIPDPALSAQPERQVTTPSIKPNAQVVPGLSSLDSGVTVLRGVSTVTSERLERLGITRVRDLLYHLPYRYDDFSALRTINRLTLGQQVTVVGTVGQIKVHRINRGRSVTRVTLRDGTGAIEVSWFNQPYLERQLKIGSEIVVSGKVSEYLGRLVLASPEWEPLERELLHTGRMVPVYQLTEGLGMHALRKLIKGVLDYWCPRMIDPIPDAVRARYQLAPLGEALAQIHFPNSQADLDRARRRLCFDEFLLLQLGLLLRRNTRQQQPGRALEIPHDALELFTNRLPFRLTAAQRRAIDEITADMSRSVPMSRLLQGDVGSGKTVVAVAAALAVARNGLQTAIMAPTAILAEQHYHSISRMLAGFRDIRCELLVGSLSNAEKARLRDDIASGLVHIAIGTHALIQREVSFARLGLVIVDEQHRFGVSQRAELRAKGVHFEPHLLAMSATPIPRSLALTVYGDLDVSVLDELPPNRQQVITRVRDSSARERIYAFMRDQISAGRQAFVICPLIEGSEVEEVRSAIEEHRRLQEQVFPRCRIGLLHGKMPAEEKDQVMLDFYEKKYDILVSTSVVEVGVDIPNATVILIEGAERFGLAQLHQFRGRVGRGEHQSYCILLSDNQNELTYERLNILQQTNDGFEIAQKDLELRGPGDLIGLRQHGLPLLRIANLADLAILEQARQAASEILARDAALGLPEHQMLAQNAAALWTNDSVTY